MYALEQHGARVQETGREDRGSLGCQELPPRRAGLARRRIDARNTQDLPRSRHVSKQTFLSGTRQANQHHVTPADESAGSPTRSSIRAVRVSWRMVIFVRTAADAR